MRIDVRLFRILLHSL